ncbi:alpha/beta hydrolase [Bacillus sp. Marseille-P3661]|uniref:alpha/beta hydrolase n=1 Tax=Bacillus sp. Marseille-P3661 TaxID=1936234 RepID=UPI000C8500A4|nr:dienelactone hydrolase family protein [Bacillus sp. Marseille-P3661]
MNAPMVFELRKPVNAEPNQSYPAIFIMHGIGSNEQNMFSLVEGLQNQFYIFSIRGHLKQPPGYAFFTIEGYGKPHRQVFDEGIEKLTSFIDYACEEYPIDQSQMYLLGFSQGAILSMTLGLTLGNRLKGIVALSGYIPKFVKEEYKKQAVDKLSLFISHGEQDNILPYEWGIDASEYFKELGAHVTFRSYPEPHTVSLENLKDLTSWIVDRLKTEGE